MGIRERLKGEHQIIETIIEETMPQIDYSAKITTNEYQQRWKAVQAEMARKGYDLGYACGSELDRSDIAWLAGIFDPIIERYGIFIAKTGTPILVAGSEGGHVIEDLAKASGVKVALAEEFKISDEEYLTAKFRDFDDIIGEVARGATIKRVAILSSDEVTPDFQKQLLTNRFGAKSVVYDPKLLQLLKYEKSNAELKIMQQANKIADAAFRCMLAVLKPGITEIQVAATGDYVMKYLGASRTGFLTIVTSGDRNFTVISPASNKIIEDGDMVSLGLSPTFHGYHGIIRRTVKVGNQGYSSEQKKLMDTVEGLYHTVIQATIKAAKENLPANFIDEEGRKYLRNIEFTTVDGKTVRADQLPPYTFIHNTGCSECQEGYGAVTPYTEEPLGKKVALMVDVAALGFEASRKRLLKDILYAVIEDAFWVRNGEVGVYNKLPLNVQHLVGNAQPLGDNINPYFKELKI